jgi:hypothetical protein
VVQGPVGIGCRAPRADFLLCGQHCQGANDSPVLWEYSLRSLIVARERIEGLLLGADQQGDHFSLAQKIRDQLDQALDGHRGGAAQFLGDLIEWLDEHYLGR